jgi:hypothetical protein
MNLQITVDPWVGTLSQRKFAAPSRPAAQSFCATSIARHYQTMTATHITEKPASNAAHTVSVAVVSARALGSMTDGVLPAICRGTDRPTDGAAARLSGVEPPGLEAVGVGLMMGRHQLVTAVIGRSGCGKTSLVRMLCGEVRPTTGTVGLDGDDLNFWLVQRDQLLNRGIEMWKPVLAAVNGYRTRKVSTTTPYNEKSGSAHRLRRGSSACRQRVSSSGTSGLPALRLRTAAAKAVGPEPIAGSRRALGPIAADDESADRSESGREGIASAFL